MPILPSTVIVRRLYFAPALAALSGFQIVSHDFRTRMLPLYHTAYSCTLVWHYEHVFVAVGLLYSKQVFGTWFFPLFLCFLLSECV